MTNEQRRKLNRKLMAEAKWAAMTPAQRLERGANQILGALGYFAKAEIKSEEFEYNPVDAESISVNGNLRPTWQGRP